MPVLWDKKTNTIVNNESADIVRILNERFNSIAKNVRIYFLTVVAEPPVRCCVQQNH